MRKSWQLSRKEVLKGMGATISLPFLNAMASEKKDSQVSRKRFCTVYFPHGIPQPKKDSVHEDWNWFPKETEQGYEFREILKPLNPLKNQLTVFKGLSHPSCRKIGGHNSADCFLTGTPIGKSHDKNSISIDQILADKYGSQTRFDSLVISSDGGIGQPTRANTLSFNANGLPIPAQSSVRRIFNSMFSVKSQKEELKNLKDKKSILDDVLSHSKDLNRRLGKQDVAKMDEYLTSIRMLEKRIQKDEVWLTKPLPQVSEKEVAIDATPKDVDDYLKSIYDLMFLAFQNDTTQYATYQISSQTGVTSVGGKFPKAIGVSKIHHALAHAMNKGDGAKVYGEYLQYLTQHFYRFINRLHETQDGEGTLLSNSLVLFGSSNSHTHANVNYPLILAGGQNLGFKQGQFLQYTEKVPLANMYLTLLDKLGAPQERFADSTGQLSDILKA